VAAKPPFAGEEWVHEGDAFVRAGTGDRWTYNEEQDLWRWTCTDDQWSAVLATVPEELLAPADLDTDQRAHGRADAARGEFNEAASDYLAFAFYHRARFAEDSPVKAWRKRRKGLEAALQGIDGPDPYWLWVSKALHFAKAAVVACEMEGSIHHGRSPERDWLYSRLLELWTKRFNGKLTTGRPGNTKPGKRAANSPAIRFLLAALTPILRDDMIGAEAVKKIIQAEIKRNKTR
jgi:hypothetical protein